MTIAQTPTDTPALGLFSFNEGASVPPAALARVATLAEESGYESLWMGEHPVLPSPQTPDSPFPATLKLVDPVVALSYVAGITSRIRIATGILLLPLRNPVILAKELASLDHLSDGRLTVGIGMGYIEREAAAVGVPFAGRADRGREHLEAMRSLWEDDRPSYDGRFVGFEGVDAHPRPVQQRLPVVVGGHTDKALVLTVTHAQGWYGFGLTPPAAAAMVERIEDIARRHERPASLGPLEITVTPPRGPVRPAALRQYAQAGVHRVVLFPQTGLDLAGLADYVVQHAPSTVLTAR